MTKPTQTAAVLVGGPKQLRGQIRLLKGAFLEVRERISTPMVPIKGTDSFNENYQRIGDVRRWIEHRYEMRMIGRKIVWKFVRSTPREYVVQ